ncbi:VOC family protein [Streptomyces sp. NPDC050560]|uniref:VOC family protein n=1 Tax=Streptomyces sp. NPDC050560 TaxID=3365630 RepID=UPI0037A02ABF
MVSYPEGTPCWADAALPDLRAGQRFYGELFGWTFREAGAADGAAGAEGAADAGGGGRTGVFAQSEGKLAAALLHKRDGRLPTVWTVYFATPDAAALAARIRAHGGTVISPPGPVPPYGTAALAADPEGAVFGLWQAATRPGFEKIGEPGAYCWTEVYSRDKAVVDPFYESVFGFGGHDLDSWEPGLAGFRTWSPAGAEPGPETAIGGRTLAVDACPQLMPARFLVYFTVEDCDASAETAARLGGRVKAAPFDIPYGRIAVLHDDQGTEFAVLQDRSAASGANAEEAAGAGETAGAAVAGEGARGARRGGDGGDEASARGDAAVAE